MSGSCEYGVCQYCKKETFLQRTYFYYNIKCECCSTQHFEIVYHCNDCVPVEPEKTKVTLKTNYLKNIDKEIRKLKLEKIKNS